MFQEHKQLLIVNGGKKCAPKLSELVHAKFTALHPYCKLSPAILMTKCYSWRSVMEKGSLNLDMKLEKTSDISVKIKIENDSKDIVPPNGIIGCRELKV